MSDRLAELLRQKKLLQEHLNWLDQEIAQTATAALKGTATAPTPAPKPTPDAATAPSTIPTADAVQTGKSIHSVPPPGIKVTAEPPPVIAPVTTAAPANEDLPAQPDASEPPANTAAMRMADEIIARYQQEDAIRPDDTKRGCLLLAGIVMLLMATAFLVSWWFFYRSHQ